MKAVNTMFSDPVTEWHLLTALLKPENQEYINRLVPALFTEQRILIFDAIRKTYSDYGEVPFTGLRKNLENNIPGELLATQPTNIDAAIDECTRLAKKRMLADRALLLKELAHEFNPDDNAIASVFTYDMILADENSSITSGAQEFLDDLDTKLRGDYHFASTGMLSIDISIGGEWRPKQFGVLMGGAGSGKTALVGNSMIRMADNGDASLFISLEMQKSDLVTRWVADRLSIDSRAIQMGKVTPEQAKLIDKETIALQKLPMYVIDKAELTFPQIAYYIRTHVKKYNVRVVFIDYMQLVLHSPFGNRNQDYGDLAKKLKHLAKSLNICIVLLTQINRGEEGMNAIRDSGEVQAHADFIFQLIPEDEPVSGDPNKNVIMRFWKNRLGPTLMIPLLFVGKYQRFMDGET